MAELDDDLKATIQEGYRNFLRHREVNPRRGQRQMIGAIASALGRVDTDGEGDRIGDTPVCVVEAGTGTGKTVAYLLAVLPVARALGKQVVIATGTVSLQGQLMDRDIPDLLAATGWRYRFALAKGRGRYLCNVRLEHCLDSADASDGGRFLFEDEIAFRPDRGNIEQLRELESALATGAWRGDRDTWPEAIDDSLWRALTVDRRQCAGYRCRKFQECAFFGARGELESADCIVANHDLVMADLALGGGAILPAPEETIYIFDEAHRLADTTLRHFSASGRLQGTIQWLEQLGNALGGTARVLAEDSQLVAIVDEIGRGTDDTLAALRQAAPVIRALVEENLPDNGNYYRFPMGDVGDDIRNLSRHIARAAGKLHGHCEALSAALEKGIEGPGRIPRVDLEQVHQGVGGWLSRIESLVALWQQMAEAPEEGRPPKARWLATDDQGQDIAVSVSPVSAAELLGDNLWQRAFAVVATSATLRALNSFERFAAGVGLPSHATTLAVPGAFDYAAAAVLSVPDIGADGGDAAAHTSAVTDHLREKLDVSEATLVLFSSRRQMEAVFAALPAAVGDRVLLQGALSNGEIVRRHRERVDCGEGSVIFGLASFAEGLDLPGDYCSHVVVVKLPFAVPDDPLQSAQAEWLEARGLKPFMAMTLPDASLRLIQACGRLLRTETDAGRVTILDRRVVTKFYGRQLLDSLPPFRRDIE